MKLPRFLRFLCAAGLAVAASVSFLNAASEKPPVAPADLLVSVQVPSLMGDAWRESEVIDVFTARVYDAFRRQGFKGRIEQDNTAKPKGEQRLLEFNLMEWRPDRVGNITCTFTVSVAREGLKPARLGVFTNASMRTSSGPLGSANAYEDSAEEALRDLYRRLEKESLLPGKPETKS